MPTSTTKEKENLSGIIKFFKSITNIIKSKENIADRIKNSKISPFETIQDNKNSIPVKNSTKGYCSDIFCLQYLHLPLKNKKLKIGTKSFQDKIWPHLKHFDLSLIMLKPLLYLKIIEFKKDPTTKPKIKGKNII